MALWLFRYWSHQICSIKTVSDCLFDLRPVFTGWDICVLQNNDVGIHSAHLYVKSRSHIFNLKEESTKQWLQCRRSSASSFNIFSSEHRKWCVTFLVCLENKQNKIFVSNLKYYLLYKVWVKWNFLHDVYTFNSRLADLSNIFLEATRCHFSLWVSWHCGSLVGIK